MKYSLIVLIFILSVFHSYSQTVSDYCFERDFNVNVKDSLGNVYRNAWAGGMNFCQFSAIDLNFDGKKDLVVFDKSGNKLSTFLNKGSVNNPVYEYAPQYQSAFPKMQDWVQLIDYNNDGKEDIFTSATGGIAVYRNESDSQNGLKFTLVTPLLLSNYHPDYENLYVNTNDVPGLADIDGDGDLDILCNAVLGTYVNYHKKLSQEKYHNSDSLDFELETRCWGGFAEGATNNQITLNAQCPPYKSIESDNQMNHTGLAMLVTDLNGDGIKDLILGDTGFPGLISLINGGTKDNANMTIIDTAFPKYDMPVNIFAHPAAFSIDVDNDGKKDLLVSPNDINVSDNFRSVLFYKNEGTDASPVFRYKTNNFLQSEMIDAGEGAYPVLFDIDGDGLEDLFVGNYGYYQSSVYNYGILSSKYISKIAYFRNTGTKTSPEFSLVTTDFAGLSAQSLNSIYPAFADLDGDGDIDMLIGNSNGNLLYFENIAGKGNPPSYVLINSKYQNINAGSYSTPQIIDLDRDGLPDLLVGCKKGTIYYYRNTGTKANPVFTLVTNSLGSINVTDPLTSNFGYSIPMLFDDKGKYRLFVGSESGHNFYFKNIDNNLTGSFTQVESQISSFREGAKTGVAVADLDNDGYKDMIIGNYAGGLGYFHGIVPCTYVQVEKHFTETSKVTLFPNPSNDEVTILFNNLNPDQAVKFEFMNLTGQILYSSEMKGTARFSFNISSYPQGIYFCKLRLNEEEIVKKVVICRN
ncbi:MAG: T9SS type A sorting domain-containing protein [Bacteroidota bacterium]|nr:T9SS type A sorting domain-containing protein [Bacteroidota bacterium]